MNGKFAHIADDGTQTDVTEGVQALYDLVISSMDWGSGFWSYEDALPVAQIARLAGFDRCDEAEQYVREALHSKESREYQKQQAELGRTHWGEWNRVFPHDHVFSSAGKCMWRGCFAQDHQTADQVIGSSPWVQRELAPSRLRVRGRRAYHIRITRRKLHRRRH